MYSHPYATANSLIERVDLSGEGWYHDVADDLHLRDFIWFTCMREQSGVGEVVGERHL